MSFNDFSSYRFDFDRLDAKLQNADDQKKYHSRWMEKYAGVFKNRENNFVAVEWTLRSKKAMRSIFSSATFLIEAKKNLEMKCFSSYYFCLYYSLFHATYSCVFLDSETRVDKLFSMTHSKLIKIFASSFANSNADIATRYTLDLFLELKHKREIYSYMTPFNNLFDYGEDLEKLERILLECYQLTSFQSLMIEKSYRKNIGKVIKLADIDELDAFNKLFHNFFSVHDVDGDSLLDPSSKNLRNKLLKYGFAPEYIALDLDHQFDEFHTYDGFCQEYDNSEYALEVLDIWSLIARALM